MELRNEHAGHRNLQENKVTDQRPPLGLNRGLTSYGDQEFARYLRRSFARSMGYSDNLLSRPIIGIASTYSDFNNCHRGVPEIVAAIKRGVLSGGGLPLEFPTISLGEPFLTPTSIYFRNLMSMDTEEMIRGQPMDAVVLVGGCDKTVPAQLMGAASANRPAVQVVTGPMITGRWRGRRVGACTDCRRFWAQYRAGSVDTSEINDVESKLAPTYGTCAVMGTASTMAIIAETLGMMLPGTAAIPAVHADRLRAAEASGIAAVNAAKLDLTPGQIITKRSVENALRVLLAIGGSTNAIIHLTAIAGRLGIKVSLLDLNRLSDETPVLVDLKPTGEHYMEDFHAAGGVSAVLHELRESLHLDCVTISGNALGKRIDEKPVYIDRSVIRSRADPIRKSGGLVALHGNLAPRGAIIKTAAATPALFEREARAVVFTSLEDLAARIDSPSLKVSPIDALVLQNAGPTSSAAMPEAGYLPIPAKLARSGITDMIRISDARMSGTAFGTVILHAAPDAASGGAIGLVRDGDVISLSVSRKTIELRVSEDELQRRAMDKATESKEPLRGYKWLYHQQILQADEGCDFAFLRAL